jgi:hypothetical protein
MTKEKKIILGALAAVGGILLYARAKKKRELTNSGVDTLNVGWNFIGDGEVTAGDTPTVNLPSQQKSDAELLKQYGIEV